jgi:hypothetical protein
MICLGDKYPFTSHAEGGLETAERRRSLARLRGNTYNAGTTTWSSSLTCKVLLRSSTARLPKVHTPATYGRRIKCTSGMFCQWSNLMHRYKHAAVKWQKT